MGVPRFLPDHEHGGLPGFLPDHEITSMGVPASSEVLARDSSR